MPHKKKESTEKKLRVNIWVSESEYEKYQECSEDEGRSFSNWSRTLMNKEVKKQGKA